MNITEVLDVVRFAVYAWVIYEIASLITTYYFSYKDFKSSYILGLLLMSTSILFLFVTLMIINVISAQIPSILYVIRNGVILPSVLIGLSAHFLRFIYKTKL